MFCFDNEMFGRRKQNLRRRKQEANYTTIDGVPVFTVYVGNIPKSATSLDVYNIFKTFGHVVEINLVPPAHTKETMFGFVTFKTTLEAARALNARRAIRIRCNKIFISVADSWHQREVLLDGTLVQQFKENMTDEDEEADPVNDEDASPIVKLNDDCLRLIFTYLPLVQRLELNSVCRRWRDVNKAMWGTVRQLDFTKSPLCDTPLTIDLLNKYLKICENLTSINISQGYHNLDSRAIASIAKECANLEEISFWNIDLHDRSLALLAHFCPKLTHFNMEGCSNCHEGELISLLKKCSLLQELSIKFNFNVTLNGLWLKHLNAPIRKLTLQACHFRPVYLVQGLQKISKTIKELSLISCRALKRTDLSDILDIVPDLTAFRFAGTYRDFNAAALSPITNLKHITELDFERNHVICDSFIKELQQNCPQIKRLNLSRTGNNLLTSNGLCLAANFPDLTCLQLGYLPSVTDQVLSCIAGGVPNIEILELMGCSSVTDEGCKSIVTSCHSLEKLDVSGCQKVTNLTVLTAIESARVGPRTKRLVLIVGGSHVDVDLDWDSSNVLVDHRSTCFWGFRPESEDSLFLDEIHMEDLVYPIDVLYGFEELDLLSFCSDEDDDDLDEDDSYDRYLYDFDYDGCDVFSDDDS